MAKKYKLRDGIVQTTVCGETLLVATRQLRGECPYTLHLDESAVYLLSLLESGTDEHEMIAEISTHFCVGENCAAENLKNFVDVMEGYGCIVAEEC